MLLELDCTVLNVVLMLTHLPSQRTLLHLPNVVPFSSLAWTDVAASRWSYSVTTERTVTTALMNIQKFVVN